MEAGDLRNQIAHCISQRKNLEAIFNSVNDGILAVDAHLQVVNLNRAAQDILGVTHEDALGEPCTALLRKADDPGGCELADAVRSGQMLQGREMRICRPDGQVRALEATTHVLQDEAGRPQGVVAILRDVTELQRLRTALRERERFERLIGKSHRMLEIYQLIEDIGESDATVLILGESGTGKELVAEAIHRRSHRRGGAFVKVNCSALSEGLLESELFGHVKGAFTGAIRDKAGRFELADGGTIFLDEIGEISPAVQVKLLRVLQEREFERVGGTETLHSDVRVIAATNRDLKQRMAEGRFRDDLYYRLYVVPIELPALRERKEDLPLLLEHFLEKFRQQTGKPIAKATPEVTSLMMDYDWPGNVRELENAVEHAFVKCHSEAIDVRDLPLGLVRDVGGAGGARPGGDAPEREWAPTAGDGVGSDDGTSEKERLLAALKWAGWNQSRAARMLGMHRTTLWRKIKEYGIEVPKL